MQIKCGDDMNSDEIISHLKTIVNNDDAYCKIAERIDWIDILHEDFVEFAPFVILTVNILQFPKGYVELNFPEAFVRAELLFMAVNEEWDDDFWKPTEDLDRKALLENEQSRGYYTMYNTVKYPEFKELSEEELISEFMSFAKKVKLEEEKIERFKEAVHGAQSVLIGYDDYWSSISLDVKGDTVILLNCINYD